MYNNIILLLALKSFLFKKYQQTILILSDIFFTLV